MMPIQMIPVTPGDAPPATFDELLAGHRRAIHLFCYRMVASYTDAEDLVQDAMMRAWKARHAYDATTGALGFRRWLYRIATNVCLDFLKSSSRKVAANAQSYAEVPWLQPYPDQLLDEDAAGKEQVALGYLALIQLLPAQQRAVFVLRDVLEWSAQEVADALDVSVAAANSALQRARESVERHAPSYPTPSAATDEEREVLAAFIRSHEGADAAACVALMSKNIRVTMPPLPACFIGPDAMAPLLERAFTREGEWRCLPVWANRQPAAVCYLRRPGDTVFRAFAIEVLRVGGGLVEEITTFDATLVAAFGCPDVLP